MKLFLFVLVFLSGCCDRKILSNDEIIKETKKCEENGFKVVVIYNAWGDDIMGVRCFPQKRGK